MDSSSIFFLKILKVIEMKWSCVLIQYWKCLTSDMKGCRHRILFKGYD